jgi:peptidoglycan/LPS O-acetylase OafA/YrhL
MTDHRLPSAAVVILASVIAAAGMMAHNVFEFGPAFLLDPQTLIPLAIFGLFALLAWARPANAVVHVALLAWAVLNLVGGGILSVLPLGLFPFQPEQSLGHYAVHVLYAVAQLPLIVVAGRALSRREPQAAGEGAR